MSECAITHSFKLYILSVMQGRRNTPDAYAVGIILSLFAVLYGIALRVISFLYKSGLFTSDKVRAKVISVGNITLGGTGKTPFTIMLADRINNMGRKPAVLIRGYGEDESHLLMERLRGIPVLVGADRTKNAERAIREFKSESIILDDGFQHRSIKRDLDIVLIDASIPLLRMKLFPAGLLREPLSRLKDADIAVLTKVDMEPDNRSSIYKTLKDIKNDIIIAESVYKASGLKKIDGGVLRQDYIKGKRVALLAAIVNTRYFEWMVENLGACVGIGFYYSDHHIYTKKDIDSVVERCSSMDIDIVITTEKDMMRSGGNGTSKLPDLIRSIKAAGKIDFISLMIDCVLTKNEEGIVGRLHSLFNS